MYNEMMKLYSFHTRLNILLAYFLYSDTWFTHILAESTRKYQTYKLKFAVFLGFSNSGQIPYFRAYHYFISVLMTLSLKTGCYIIF